MRASVGWGIGTATVLTVGLIAGEGLVFSPRLEAQLPVLAPVPVEPGPKAEAPVSGCAPRFFMVTKIDERGIGVEDCTLVKQGKLNVFNTVHVETSWGSVQALDAAGNKRTPEWVRKHVQAGDIVLLAADDQPLAPAYLRVLRQDAVILLGLGPVIQPEKP